MMANRPSDEERTEAARQKAAKLIAQAEELRLQSQALVKEISETVRRTEKLKR